MGSNRDQRFDGVAAPDGGVGLPAVRTLSDEFRDAPEPNDSDREPPPEPHGIVRRLADRFRRFGSTLRR